MPSGTSKNPAQRALKRIAPKLLELVIVSLPIARTFCVRLLDQYLKTMSYFDPAQDWPQPIEDHVSMAVVWEELAFLGDTRSRHELLVFAQANQSRLPLAMGIVQPHIPVRRMASERKTQLTDAFVRILRRFLTPATISMDGAHDSYYREHLLPLAAHGDGHVLTVSIALLLAILTGRSDLCIAGVFGAGKTRSLAVLLIAPSCELKDFVAIIYTKENVAAKALADQLSDLAPPTIKSFGRLIGRMEEGKGEAYASKIDVRCSDRNRIISHKRRYSSQQVVQLRRKWRCAIPLLAIGFLAPGLPFMDESQQYGNYHEIAALAAIQQPTVDCLYWRPQTNSRRAVQRPSSGCQSTQTVATAVRAPSTC